MLPVGDLTERHQEAGVELRFLRDLCTLSELEALVRNGLTQAQFEDTRDYLMKNVFLMTATQDQQLGYVLDAQWYAVPEFTRMMRDALAKLVRGKRVTVNAVVTLAAGAKCRGEVKATVQ